MKKFLFEIFERILTTPFVDAIWLTIVSLKLVGFIDWSWWIIMIPLFMLIFIVVAVFISDIEAWGPYD